MSDLRNTQTGLIIVGAATSGVRNTQTGSLVVAAPPYPTLEGEAVGEHQINLTMGAGDGATSHELHRGTTLGFAPGPSTLLASYGATVPATYSDAGAHLDAGTTYFYSLIGTVGGVDWARSISVTTLGFTAPTLYVGQVQSTSAILAVDTLSEYLEVEYKTTLSGAILSQTSQTGSGRFYQLLSLLTPSTEYVSTARVRYSGGWSDWADAVTWETLAGDITDLGCPPTWQGVHHNPDGNSWDRLGRGFFQPLPGQPLRGTEAEIVFRYHLSGTWNISISEDNGATYSLLQAGVTVTGGADADRLLQHRMTFDTTAYPDGTDYRLRAESTDLSPAVTWESMSFVIDNAGSCRWWRGPLTDAAALSGWGQIWEQERSDGGDIWKRGQDGGIGAIKGHGHSLLADVELPESDGADATVRFLIWSGEGGFFRLGGRDDTEFLHAGLGFFASGDSGGARKGIFVGIENGQSWINGCCSDYLTSHSASLVVRASQTPGGSMQSQATSDEPTKMFFKATVKPVQITWEETFIAGEEAYYLDNATGGAFKIWPTMSYRNGLGINSGVTYFSGTCARRWEVYSMRARVELDAGDRSRVRVRVRLDGPGVNEPSSGYWHLDEWIDFTSDWVAGVTGLASQQLAQSSYGGPNGARVFISSSVLPLNAGSVPGLTPQELEPWYEPQEGKPCTLVLLVYEDDRETVRWEVGEDQLHFNPFLVWPENYGEQEIDIVNGAVTIGQVECIVIDKAQEPGDQDTGWMTERLGEDGIGIMTGRRCRLLRYISHELGWVVIADGPASAPRLDESYAAYRFVIRDTRDTERKVQAFVKADTSWVLPHGVPDGFGQYTDEDGSTQWLVPPTDPLVGEYTVAASGRGAVTFYDYWSGSFFNGAPIGSPQTVDEEVVVIPQAEDSFIAEAQELGNPRPVLWTWEDMEILWRPEGSSDAFTVIQPTDLLVDGQNVAKPTGAGRWWRKLITVWDAELADGSEVRAVSAMILKGYLASGTFPTDGDSIEVAIRWKGQPTDFAPLHIDGLTTGQLLKKLYDGDYSYPDPVTGDSIPTGIRYNETDLLQMTDPVRLRITEPVTDGRDWAEKHIYAPTGWVPALNNDGEISPKSQVPPYDFTGELLIDNAHTEPSSSWGGGERFVNALSMTYPRLYPVDVADATAVDLLAVRDVSHEYEKLTKQEPVHSRESADYDGSAFAAIGDDYGEPVMGLQAEEGYKHFVARKLYILDRYQDGAPIIEVAVMRTHCARVRAGDFVRIDLSWFPNYSTQERGMLCGAQVLAVHDVDCAWRILLLEKVEPATRVS